MDMTGVNDAVADAKQRCEDGLIPWTYAVIKKEITPYSNKHCLDVLLPGQEDEATNDIDRCKCDEDRAESEQGDNSDADGPIEDFCPEDWVDEADAEVVCMKKVDKDAQRHGHSATALVTVETVDEDAIELSFNTQ